MSIVDGFRLFVASAELQRLLEGRASYHTGRANDKEAEVPALKALLERTKTTAVPDVGNNSYAIKSADPVGSLETDIRGHRAKAARFAFYASHLGVDRIYSLNTNECSQLELLEEE